MASNTETTTTLDNMPPTDQSFTVIDDYKTAKRDLKQYVRENIKKFKGAHYFTLYEEYKRVKHYYVVNSDESIPSSYTYVLANVGPIAALKIHVTHLIHNIAIDGATFLKASTALSFCCDSIELRNCTWSDPTSALHLLQSCGKVIITNPAGIPTITFKEYNPPHDGEDIALKLALLSRLLALEGLNNLH